MIVEETMITSLFVVQNTQNIPQRKMLRKGLHCSEKEIGGRVK